MVENIGKRLKYARAKRHLSQSDLASRLSIKPNNIGHYESGKSQPRLETIVRLAEELECSLEWLITGKGEKPLTEQEAMLESLLYPDKPDETRERLKELAHYLSKELKELELGKTRVTDSIAGWLQAVTSSVTQSPKMAA